MRTTLVTWAQRAAIGAAMLFVATWVGRPMAPVDAGTAAPVTVGRTADGARFDLAALKGTPAVVNVWATWCPPCMKELPAFDSVARRLDGKVRFVGLAVSSPPEHVAAVSTRVSYPLVAIDGRTQSAWKASAVPSTYLLDGCQNIVWSTQGAIDEHVLDDAIASHLPGDATC